MAMPLRDTKTPAGPALVQETEIRTSPSLAIPSWRATKMITTVNVRTTMWEDTVDLVDQDILVNLLCQAAFANLVSATETSTQQIPTLVITSVVCVKSVCMTQKDQIAKLVGNGPLEMP